MIEYRFPLNPNWISIVTELNTILSYVKIGSACGMSDVGVLKLKTGKSVEPLYSNGIKIMLLYLDVFKKQIPEHK